MTDEQIIKALEYCSTDIRENTCPKCAFYKKHRCSTLMLNAVSDLINRKKAEIERLEKEHNEYPVKTIVGNNCEIHSKTSKDYDNLIADIGSGAIKEFAERLKESIYTHENRVDIDGIILLTRIDNSIDTLVKEMTQTRGSCGDRI